ncbi:MAG: phage virion morphogenesis protein [Magnetococcales bacterium]|nr:phage virion morphogenesis protein [Magnetococcales bacterium]
MSTDLIQIYINDRPIIELLDRAIARGRDMSTPFQEIATVMQYAVEENFLQEGRPSWVPLAEATIAEREKKHPGSTMKILQDSGRLATSITSASDAFSAQISTDTIYAAIHNFGGPAGRGRSVTIPARPFMVLLDDDLEEIIDILERHLAGE